MSVRSKPNLKVEAPAEPERDGSELPEGWTHCRVDDVFNVSSGGTPSRSEPRYWNGNVPWLSSGDIKMDEIDVGSEFITEAGLQNSTAKLCEAGSVVVVVRSGILKHTLPVALLRRPAAINQDMKCFNSGDDDLNRWLALALRTASRDILAENREGTTVQSVKSETLREFAFPLPPLAEQRRIVTKLDLLLGKVSSNQQRLSRVPGLLKRFRQSVLAAACSGKLTADWREENGGVMEDWKESSLLNLLADPLANGRSVRDAIVGFPVLRLTCLKNGRIDLSERKIGEWTKKDAARFLVKKDDFFVSRGNGSHSLVGRGGLVIDEPDDVAFPDTIIRVRLRKDMLSPEFLASIWNSIQIRSQIETAAHTTAGIWKISQGDMEGFLLPVPPLSEQKEIVLRVEKLFAFAGQIEARLSQAQSHVDRLTQSLLAKAFRGQLVPQDPRDEPASVLLERIKDIGDTRNSVPERAVSTRKREKGRQVAERM